MNMVLYVQISTTAYGYGVFIACIETLLSAFVYGFILDMKIYHKLLLLSRRHYSFITTPIFYANGDAYILYIFQNKLQTSGFIYKDVYRGWYSVIDECFYSDKDVQDVNGKKV
uniref:7TM_GPCR_Srx domain-containing protein n=1 Tax=Heterorhabditis bacteriophora TaxID=37862 RepID=A0A1I7XGR6_HETBA